MPNLRSATARGNRKNKMIHLFWSKTKRHCSDCFRSTRAFFLYNRFLSWFRCSRCWTVTERFLVQLKLNIKVLHLIEYPTQRRVTTVTRYFHLEEHLPIGYSNSVEGSVTAFVRG